MVSGIKYIHTNLVARDWRALASFYERVMGCVPVPPERDYTGAWLGRLTGIDGAALRGVHLRLPGCGEDGPTLEIFQYSPEVEPGTKAVNRPGFTHLAFIVEDLEGLLGRIVAEGGHPVGETIELELPGAGVTTSIVYVTDPEGNILELQQRH